MPSLGSDMAAGTLVAWRKAVGDTVRRGDVYAEVETDKGVLEVEAYEGGVVEALLVPLGEKVPVGAALARLQGGAGASAPPSAAPPIAPLPGPLPFGERERGGRAISEETLHHYPPSIRTAARALGVDPFELLAKRFPHGEARAAPSRAKVTPRARRRATELGVDVDRLAGTGPDGAVTTDDVEHAAAASAPAPTVDPALRMRRAIAASMERSNREIPHYWVGTTIDLSAATRWLEETNRTRSVETRVVIGALLVKAAALALRRMPELNAAWIDGTPRIAEHVHLGIAISLRGGGLVAPAIHDADRLDLAHTMSALGDLVTRARAGKLRSSELADPTATVTSLGDRGVESVMPLVSPGQVAMIGFGKPMTRPWVVGDRIEPRPVVVATLAGDHRATDGHRGAAFLARIDDLLQHPATLDETSEPTP
jgi:pyruvate dehydrogenase E2 component (dihydrolipoamide acetyltransferase)